jgi:threonine dehydratase
MLPRSSSAWSTPWSSPIRAAPEPSQEDLRVAAGWIAERLAPTPLIGGLLKVETVQPTGSFKVRGALAALRALSAGTEVVAASAGNHGLGVAWAAGELGLDATIVVPETASPAKVAGLRRFAVRVIQAGDGYDGAEAHALELTATSGRAFVSPYNDPWVIAGQASLGFELDAQTSGPLTIVCPVGGGGLISGVALWASGREDVRVVGVEPEASAAMAAAVEAGGVVPVAVGPTLSDGTAGNIEEGSVTVEVVRREVAELVTVSEEDLARGIRHLAFEHGLVVEGAGAMAMAALLAGKVEVVGRAVALVTGRNIAASRLVSVLNGGH